MDADYTNIAYKLIASVTLCILSACAGSGESASSATSGSDSPKLKLEYSSAPIDLHGIPNKFVANIPYANHSDTTFDIILPDTSEPSALVIYFHGGGFIFGDKSAAYGPNNIELIQEALSHDVAFASVGYRLVGEQDQEGLMKPLNDSRRALQFIRYYASSLNIDPTRIAAYGVSAGGATSLWLAFHDDMADPLAPDPIERQSTRISVAAAEETQASYDLERWATDIFDDYGLETEQLLALSGLNAFRLRYYGISDITEIANQETIDYREQLHMLGQMSIDDPPIFIRNKDYAIEHPTTMTLQYHHANHAMALRNKAEQLGMQGIFYIPELDVSDPSEEELMPFLLRHTL